MLMDRPNTALYAAVISSLVDPMRGPILPRKLSAFGMPRRVVRRRDRSGNRSGRLLALGACVEGRERDHGASCVASAPSRAGGSASFSRSAKGMRVRRSMCTARSRPSAISPYSLVRPMPRSRRASSTGTRSGRSGACMVNPVWRIELRRTCPNAGVASSYFSVFIHVELIAMCWPTNRRVPRRAPCGGAPLFFHARRTGQCSTGCAHHRPPHAAKSSP